MILKNKEGVINALSGSVFDEINVGCNEGEGGKDGEEVGTRDNIFIRWTCH